MATKVTIGKEMQRRKIGEWLRSRLLSASGVDALIALALWFGFFALVVWRAEEIGVGYDEPIYGGYAFKYLAWLQYLWSSWSSVASLTHSDPKLLTFTGTQRTCTLQSQS